MRRILRNKTEGACNSRTTEEQDIQNFGTGTRARDVRREAVGSYPRLVTGRWRIYAETHLPVKMEIPEESIVEELNPPFQYLEIRKVSICGQKKNEFVKTAAGKTRAVVPGTSGNAGRRARNSFFLKTAPTVVSVQAERTKAPRDLRLHARKSSQHNASRKRLRPETASVIWQIYTTAVKAISDHAAMELRFSGLLWQRDESWRNIIYAENSHLEKHQTAGATSRRHGSTPTFDTSTDGAYVVNRTCSPPIFLSVKY